MIDDDDVILMTCEHHAFHEDCAYDAIREMTECPTCHKLIVVEDLRKLKVDLNLMKKRDKKMHGGKGLRKGLTVRNDNDIEV